MTTSERFGSARAAHIDALIEPIARAIATDRATALAATLANLGASGAFADEHFFAEPGASRYSRARLWADPAGRFAVVCMTWLPGQGTPVHDHAGRWGAELVVHGSMRETSYRLAERDAGGRARLVLERETRIAAAQIGVVLPTVDVHQLHNDGPEIARTVHVYSSLVDACTTFTPGGDGWWTLAPVSLTYDA